MPFDLPSSPPGYNSNVDRTLLVVRGDHAGQHLQRFCTADLSSLNSGEGREAMFLNAKGKLVGFVEAYFFGDHWLLAGSAGQAETLAVHLDRYVVREDVQFQDLAQSHSATAIIGQELMDNVRQKLGVCLEVIPTGQFDGKGSYLLNSRELGSEGLWWVLPSETQDDIQSQLNDLNGNELSADAADALRVFNQYPQFGTDICEDHLPQELQRDSLAISFTKGCYLGQETVARIDALGHVNRLVCGFEGKGVIPQELPMEIFSGDTSVGQLTSVSPVNSTTSWLGLGTIKRNACKASNDLAVNGEALTLRPPLT